MALKHQRTKEVFGENFAKLTKLKVLLLGLGGVGGFCLECLYRSGVEHITVVDFDVFDVTNQNRQLYSALHVGKKKTKALQHYFPNITLVDEKITPQWVEEFDFEPFDVVLDAIDDTKVKIALALKCHKKLISSFGSGKRVDASKIKVAPLWQTKGDRLGAKIRYELRKRGFGKNYTVIYSDEEVKKTQNGSFMGVTGSFGLFMCSEAIKKGLKCK